MPVIVNEFEMAPAAPAAQASPRQEQAAESSPKLTVKLLRDIERAMRCKQQRVDRLTAC